MIYLITGGERSGKSSYTQKLALSLSSNPIYLATSRIWDNDFSNRVELHKKERGPEWQTIEEEKDIASIDINNGVVVIDCITLWLTNIFTDHNGEINLALEEAKDQLERFTSQAGTFLFVTNEIGMGVHAATNFGRKFVELQGWINQYIASKANRVTLMVSGIPVEVKAEL